MANIAALVVLVQQYIGSVTTLHTWSGWLLNFFFLFVIMVINMNGVQWVSQLSLPILIAVFIPFVTEFIMIFVLHRRVYWESLGEIPTQVNWSVLLSTSVWSFGGFDTIGSLAGEVKGGTRTYICGLAGALPLTLFTYVFPVILSYLVFPYREKWGDHTFTDVAFTYTQSLGVSMLIASVLSNFGQANANVAATSRQIWAMAMGKEGGLAEHRYLPYILSISSVETNIPYLAILLVTIIVFGLTALGKNTLVQLYFLLRLVTLYLEYAALIYLKWKEPDTPRPFAVPGGKVGSILLFIPSIIIGLTALATAEKRVLILGGAAAAVVFCTYPIKLFWIRFTHKYDVCRPRKNGVEMD
eukprot:TRINITY_DN4840_c0_g1_i14.p1 TRINITY_DN4840_c0_g1~~TRINITY_DN4840_c0_g1_i14.p1  ORF type:complete len:356 (-),score=43.36 TRINITY_DN4840_c0_g1_i14:90-1157(-)